MGNVRHLRPAPTRSGQKLAVTFFFENLPSVDIGELSDEFERVGRRFHALERPLLTIEPVADFFADDQYQFVQGAKDAS